VSKVAGINFTFFGMKMTNDIFSTEAIANSSDFLPHTSQILGLLSYISPIQVESITHLGVVLVSQLLQGSFDNRVNLFRAVPNLPLANVKVCRPIEWNWVPVKKVRHYNEISIGSKLVCDELRVDEAMANHISQAKWWLENHVKYITQELGMKAVQ
jgi:hypothetical protein